MPETLRALATLNFKKISKNRSVMFGHVGCAKGTLHMLALSTTLHKKWNFPLRISLVNVTKSAGNCPYGHIY